MQDTNTLRARLAQLATERKNLVDQQSPLNARMNDLHEIITQATAALNDRRHWQQEGGLRTRLDAAKKERGPIAQKLQILERHDRELTLLEIDYRKDLARAEYLSTTSSDVQAEIGATLVDIREANARMASLNEERASLIAKQEDAKRAANVLRAAEGELTKARDSHDQRKAEAFIAGREIDLGPYSARVAKADKRLEEARRNADAGLAALPLIARRLGTLASIIEESTEDREAAKKRYWIARTRLLEIKYRELVAELIETAGAMRALGRKKTGRQLGSRLYENVQGLLVPMTANEDYPQPVRLVEPDDGALLIPLEDELETALLAEELETI